MVNLFACGSLAAGFAVVGAACAGGPRPVPPPGPTPGAGASAGASPASPALPPIPHLRGPVSISVVYPHVGAVVMSRDSNFILGSVGTGDATLTINGFNVPVKPNGAFLAWLPVPDSASSRYDLVAALGADTVRMSHPIRLEPSRRSAADSAAADSLLAVARPPPFPDSGRFAVLVPADSTASDTDRMVIARPVAGGTYKWFLLPGTVTQITGRSPGYERIRLDDALEAWVSLGEVRVAPLPPGRAPQRVVGAVRVIPEPDWVDVALSVGDRPPYLVEESGNDLVLTFYSTQASTSLIQYVGSLSAGVTTPDTLVRSITWEQETTTRARYTIHLTRPSYGYLVLWTGSAFVLRVRRTPAVEPASPLHGLSIAVDAGHPPAGATGPTGLYEAVATLAVAQRVEAMLISRGASVVMTRTTADAVELGARPVMARRSGAVALVSIHLNALPDGMNPFTSHGTGTYFYHPHSVALARAVQTGMVRAMGLRDLGIHYDNLALVRPTWMPAVLCEGAFVIIPEQEAALRTPEFQTAYARGVVDGLESFFRGLAVAPSGRSTSPPPPGVTPAATSP